MEFLSTRSPRSTYWALLFVVVIGAIVIAVLPVQTNISQDALWLLVGGFIIAANIAGIAFGIRRLHDLDASGWWVLFQFVPIANLVLELVLLFWPGTAGANRFGPPPA